MFHEKKIPPLHIQVHPQDTVAIIVNVGGLPAGTSFDSGLTLLEDVPEAHKVALIDIKAGAPILRYGSVIGYAEKFIAKGSWVHSERIRLPVAPSLDNLPLATSTPPSMSPLEGYTFEGFLNDDGSVGTKNILGITTTVQCVAATVDIAVKRIKAEILPRYPNVDDVIALTHNYGCGVAINAPGAEIPNRPATLGHCLTITWLRSIISVAAFASTRKYGATERAKSRSRELSASLILSFKPCDSGSEFIS